MPTIAKVNSAHNIRMSIRYARDSKDEHGSPKLHDSIGINCDPKSAEYDFESTNFVNAWSDRRHVQLRKFVLGFGPLNQNSLNDKEAHVYTERFLKRLNQELGGGWRMVAYSHKDHPESYHYHIVIDNCNFKSGKKLTSIYQDVKKLRALNDKISKSFGIKPIQKSRLVARDMPEIKGQEKAQKRNTPRYSYQDHVRVLMSKAMLRSSNLFEFKQALNHNNADLKSNFTNQKSKIGTIIIPSIQPNGNYNHDKNGNRTKRKVRTGKLGLAFDKNNILEQLSKPINKRDSKYMSIYKQYSHTPSSVILKYITPTPNIGNNGSHSKTSSKYLTSNSIRSNFKNKGEVKHDKEFELIRKIQKLNKEFAKSEPISQQSNRAKGRSTELSKPNNRSTERRLKSIQNSRRKFAKSNNRFTKSIIDQPRIELTSSERKQQSSSGESEIKRQKQSVNHSTSILQGYKAGIRIFRKREWRKVIKQARRLRSWISERRQSFEDISQKFANTLSNFRDSNQYLSARKKGKFIKAKEILQSMKKSKKVLLPKLFKEFKNNWLNHNALLHYFHNEHYKYIQHKLGYSYARINKHGETNLETFYKNLSPKSKIYMLSLTALGDSELKTHDFIKLSRFYLHQKNVHPNFTYGGIRSMPLSNKSHSLLKIVQGNSKQLNIHDSSLVDDVVLNMYLSGYNLGNKKHYSDVISKGNVFHQLSSYNGEHGLKLKYNYISTSENNDPNPVRKVKSTNKQPFNNTNTINRQRELLKNDDHNNRKKKKISQHRGPHMHM